MSGEVMAFLDSNIPLKQVLVAVIAIGGAVFSLGQIQQRFNVVESTITSLVEDEENMATKEEIEVIEQRLDKKIQILNEKEEQIHNLELELQMLKIKFEEHNH
tara:strand:- start:17 stop:325 length:309 start_codon:yes stop_codon:yes gene_type:complete